MSKKILIAVYGTLRKTGCTGGYGNYRAYLSDSKFLGMGKTVNKYQLTANGIPFVNKTPDTQIIVDVFEVDTNNLMALDRLESHPNWYKREEIPIELKNGKKLTAWLYFNEESRGNIIKSGDFADYTR